MLRQRTLALFATPLLLGLLVAACGGSDGTDDTDSSGSGGTGSGTGGNSNGSGGNPNGTGGSTPGTGGSGTGGADTATPVPGAENYDCSPASGTAPQLKLLPILDGFDRAVLVTHAPGETDRLFVVQQNGEIWIVNKTGTGVAATYAKGAAAFIDLKAKVKSNGEGGGYTEEQGLLGLAFHPDYATNGLFYVHYSADDALADSNAGDTIIEEYQVSADADVADDTSARRVLHIGQPDSNHNGGTITFGPDGYMYIFLGDGGGGNDQHGDIGNAQDVTNLLGDVLRIDPTGAAADEYTPAASGNLIDIEPTAAPEIWDYGLRNPFRDNFDGCTGDLYIGDVGQDHFEEINITAAGVGNKNFGWRITEGLLCRAPDKDTAPPDDCDKTGITMPFATVVTNSTSIVGGSVYRGAEIPALRGTYFYATTGKGGVYSLVYNGTDLTSGPTDLTNEINPDVGGRQQITSMQNGGEGEIYVTSLSSTNLFKLAAQ